MKLALVYDRLNKLGGAEEILLNLRSIWPRAPWYTSVHSQRASFSSGWQINSSFISNIPVLRNNHELFPFLMPYIFENFNFDTFDVVFSTSSSEAKGIITKPKTLHINYCLTPTRYLWSHKQEYLTSRQFGILQPILRPIITRIFNKLSNWDTVAATRPDLMISISEHVKKRVKKYYNRDSLVIYPPVRIKRFKDLQAAKPQEMNYYLTVSRLVPYKRIDLIISAFNKSGKKLIIIGVGSQLGKLKKLANDNIIFKDQVAENELVGYYQNCRAFVQANEEDFGIAMVEALAAGKPVIAFSKGGAAEIITPKTGILFAKQQIWEIIRAVDKFETMKFSAKDCQHNAKRFSAEKFRSQIKTYIREEWKKHQQK